MVLFFSFPCRSAANNLPLRHKDSFSGKSGFLLWSSFAPPSTPLRFAYPMYHSSAYFPLADMRKLPGFPLISVDFTVFPLSHPSRRLSSGSRLSAPLDAGSEHGKTFCEQDFSLLPDSFPITRLHRHPIPPPAL